MNNDQFMFVFSPTQKNNIILGYWVFFMYNKFNVQINNRPYRMEIFQNNWVVGYYYDKYAILHLS